MENNFRQISSMDFKQRVPEYTKDNKDEAYLDIINNALSELEEKLECGTKNKPGHSVLITGAPRSGTTFLYQLMASNLPFAYVSNLMARFYAAPLTGAWLQTRLIHSEISELSTFESVHGVTKRIYEPHEFGYFWSRHLPFHGDNHEELDSTLSKERIIKLESTLQAIADICQKPVIYKCTIAPFILNELFARTSVFVVHIVRDRFEVTRSILNTRNERLGSVEKWWSIKPSGWRKIVNKKPQEQVDWQYGKVVNAIRQSCSLFPERCIEVKYDDLDKSPNLVLGQITEKFHSFAKSFV